MTGAVIAESIKRSSQAAGPKVHEARRLMPAGRHRPRPLIGIAILMLNLIAWLVLFSLALAAEPFWLKLALAAGLGLVTGTTFVIGHDASHGTLTGHAMVDWIAAWLAFLLSWHLPSTWDAGHNRMHHGWTNLRIKDYAFEPPAPEEFHSWSPTRRFVRRVYHTLPGISLFYMFNVWWPRIFLLGASEKRLIRSLPLLWFERFSIVGFVLAQGYAVTQFGSWASSGNAAMAAELAVLIVWPFYVWNWVMAFVTLQHHTHPRVRWYDNETEWSFYRAHVCSTVHLRFPRIIELSFANIFEHTAHHADKAIPLVNLEASQRALEQHYPDDVIVEHGSLAHLRRVLRECQLYDYKTHVWSRFP